MPTTEPLRFAAFDTPLGRLAVAFRGTTAAFTALDLEAEAFASACAARLGTRPEPAEPPARLAGWVRGFFEGAGRGRYRGPVDLSPLPHLQQRALRAVAQVRPGEVRTYGWLARAIGAPGAARAVGTAMARNPVGVLVPCHRAVRADFVPRAYGCGGPATKAQILAWEGVDLPRLQRLAAAGHQVEGSRTTRIFCLPGCYTGRRIRPEYQVGFASPAAARAAGFRACRVCQPA